MNSIIQGETVRVRITPCGGSACEYPSVYDAAVAARAECERVGKPPMVEMKVGNRDWIQIRLSSFV